MKNIIKNTFILFLITCVTGAMLGGIYVLTKDARRAQEIKTKEKAYKKVMPDAKSFEKIEYDEAGLAKRMKKDNIGSKDVIIGEIAVAKDESGSKAGYVITVTSKGGYGGDIRFTVGILNDGKVSGISVLSIKETAGLGMKAKEKDFLDKFRGVDAEKFEVVKEKPQNDGQIDAISGATITTNAMVKGVNAAKIAIANIEDYIKTTNDKNMPDMESPTDIETVTEGESPADIETPAEADNTLENAPEGAEEGEGGIKDGE